MTKRLAGILTTTALFMAPLIAHADEASTATGAPPESKGLPQFDPYWFPGQIFWLAVTFALLYLLMARLILPRIGGTIAVRDDKVASDLAAAEKAQAEAAETRTAYEALMNKTRLDSTHLLHDAGVAVKQEAERRIHELHARAEKEAEALALKLTQQTQVAKEQLQAQIAELASIAAAKIIGTQPDIGRAQTVVQSLRGTEAA